MPIKRYGEHNYRELLKKRPTSKREVLPRIFPYSDDPDAPIYRRTGGIPLGSQADMLVDPSDYKEVIQYCHENKIFPIYAQYDSWAPPGFRWSQNGLGFCWAWGITGNMMDCRSREGKPTKLLSPVSLGWTVGWQNRGNYLMSAINGMKERGVCEMEYTPNPHSLNYRQYKEGWEENALKYRLAEWWDLDNRSDSRMVQHLVTVLASGVPVYVAHNWWGHALSIVSLNWDESLSYNMAFVHRNSHNEPDVIELTGGRGIPDEAYGIRATLTVD